MKALLLLPLLACAHRVCGFLAPDEIAAFHRSHALSVTANESSVEALADADEGAVDGGTRWQVCIEGGEAKIQNHLTAQEIDMEWKP